MHVLVHVAPVYFCTEDENGSNSACPLKLTSLLQRQGTPPLLPPLLEQMNFAFLSTITRLPPLRQQRIPPFRQQSPVSLPYGASATQDAWRRRIVHLRGMGKHVPSHATQVVGVLTLIDHKPLSPLMSKNTTEKVWLEVAAIF